MIPDRHDAAVAELLRHYASLNLDLLYYLRRGEDPRLWRAPHGRDALNWNHPSRLYPLDQYDPTIHNLGMFTGTEVEPGKFVCDVDLDWIPGITLAKKIFPWTDCAFGRTGKAISHLIFTVPERFDTVIAYYDLPETGESKATKFLELFGGNRTHQTMIATSLHSPGVYIELVRSGAIAHFPAEVVTAAVLDYAIACLVLRYVTGGLHHEGRMALAGFLLNHGLSPERVITLMGAVCEVQVEAGIADMSLSDVADCTTMVHSTVKRIREGKRVAGGPIFAKFIGKRGKDVLSRLREWLPKGSYNGFVLTDKDIIVRDDQHNIRHACTLLNVTVRWDEFSEHPIIYQPNRDPRVMGDAALNDDLYLAIDEQYHFRPDFDYFKKVIFRIARESTFHPVRDYLNSLVWDGVPRINTWLVTAGGADDPDAGDAEPSYIESVSSIVLIAAVRRIRQPGCKYDEMLVWESPQGSFKSSAARALCPKPEWFSDDLRLNLRSKELIESTLGKWIIEASDLAGRRKTEREQLKAMLSRQVDGPARMAYAPLPVERPRHFILIGTTNSPVYLDDPTGARRFWPVTVKKFNLAWIIAHRDQLWAEAAYREAQGESIRLDERLWPVATRYQEARREHDPWESMLRTDLAQRLTKHRTLFNAKTPLRVPADDLWAALGIIPEHRDRPGALRLSDIMHRFGFRRGNVRVGDETTTGYISGDDTDAALTLEETPAEPEPEPAEPKKVPTERKAEPEPDEEPF